MTWQGHAKIVATAVGLLVSSVGGPSYSKATHVHIDTSRWLHYPGYLLFTYTTSIEDTIPVGGENRVCIRDLTYDGQMGDFDVEGGVSGGRYDALATQPFTWTIEPDDVPDVTDGKGRYRYSEVPLNFAKRYAMDPDALWFGHFIDFDLDLPDRAYLPADVPPDALTMTILNRDGEPAFPTGDPLGGNALVVCAPQRGSRAWQIEAFAPARSHRGVGGAKDTILIRLPSPPSSAGGPVDPPHLPPELRRVARENGVVWIEYAIPLRMSRVRLLVIDDKGAECFRRELGEMSPGIYGNEWPERGGVAPVPGRYRVILDADGQLAEKTVDL